LNICQQPALCIIITFISSQLYASSHNLQSLAVVKSADQATSKDARVYQQRRYRRLQKHNNVDALYATQNQLSALHCTSTMTPFTKLQAALCWQHCLHWCNSPAMTKRHERHRINNGNSSNTFTVQLLPVYFVFCQWSMGSCQASLQLSLTPAVSQPSSTPNEWCCLNKIMSWQLHHQWQPHKHAQEETRHAQFYPNIPPPHTSGTHLTIQVKKPPHIHEQCGPQNDQVACPDHPGSLNLSPPPAAGCSAVLSLAKPADMQRAQPAW
jgi:hypothetical protein